MAGINSVLLVGRLTKDPILQTTGKGTSFCRFTVAVDRQNKKDDQTAAADFPGVVAWRQQADFIGNYGMKGMLVAVEGSIQTGSYKDREGRTVYTTEILANRIQLLESKKSKSNYSNNGTSLRRDQIDANDGFDVGDGAEISDDDLPFL